MVEIVKNRRCIHIYFEKKKEKKISYSTETDISDVTKHQFQITFLYKTELPSSLNNSNYYHKTFPFKSLTDGEYISPEI